MEALGPASAQTDGGVMSGTEPGRCPREAEGRGDMLKATQLVTGLSPGCELGLFRLDSPASERFLLTSTFFLQEGLGFLIRVPVENPMKGKDCLKNSRDINRQKFQTILRDSGVWGP